MRVIIVGEKRLEELFKVFMADVMRSPDPSKMEEKVDQRTINYHLCQLKDALKDGGL